MFDRDHMKLSRPRPDMPVYIRFGFWSGHSTNHYTGAREPGVSVYRAEWRNGIVALKDDVSTQLYGQGRLVIPVQGECVALGSDGEQLLHGAKAIKAAIDIDSIPQECKDLHSY